MVSESSVSPNQKPDEIFGDNISDVGLEAATFRGDIFAALACLAFGVLGYFVLTPMFVFVPEKFAGTVNSPAFLPKLLFILLIFLSLCYLAQGVSAFRKYGSGGRTRLYDWVLASGVMLVCISYIAAIFLIGMTAASVLGIAALTYYFGERKPVLIAALSILIPMFLWYFFESIAHVFLPKGTLFSGNFAELPLLANGIEKAVIAATWVEGTIL
jgi:hypothetical protein